MGDGGVRGRVAGWRSGVGGQVYLPLQKLTLGNPLGAVERVAVLRLLGLLGRGAHHRCWRRWYALLECAEVMQCIAGRLDYRV